VLHVLVGGVMVLAGTLLRPHHPDPAPPKAGSRPEGQPLARATGRWPVSRGIEAIRLSLELFSFTKM
jgi:hypothetical protein